MTAIQRERKKDWNEEDLKAERNIQVLKEGQRVIKTEKERKREFFFKIQKKRRKKEKDREEK